MKFKKLTAVLSALAMSAGMLSTVPAANAADVTVNYGEALQKSLFFYEAQQAGVLPEWNSVSWRADSMIKEDGTPSDIIDGGWFDAGDHLKFTLTNAYTSSVLAWGLIEYTDAVKSAGLYDSYLRNLKWGLDYVAACDLGDKVIGTIGEDSFDHVWYGSPEVYMRKFNLKNDTEERPYDTITNCSTIAQMAAAMASGYIVFKDEDPEAAKSYLKHAESLFKLANDVWAENGDDANVDEGIQGKYYYTRNNQGTDNFIDELMYSANWMYMATGDKAYLDKCENEYIPLFPLENQSTDKKYTWGFCWDDTVQAAALLYAINTGKQEWIDHVSHHLEFWINGYGGKSINETPDGMPVLQGWGVLRYAENTAWIAKLSCDTIFKDNPELSKKYNDWAKKMMDYAFGDNDLGLCYVVGMGDKNPVNIHHRGASGIHDDYWQELGTEKPEEEDAWQREYAHVLYGALEGGPSADGTFTDTNASYMNTEVAIDYNAGYTAALCAFIEDYGGEKLADFPPVETPKWEEWKIGASLNGKGNSYSEVKIWTMNHTAWPARVEKDIKFRYYFDASEIFAVGLTPDDITVSIGSQQYQQGQQGYATTTGKAIKYEGDPTGNTYYAEIVFEDGRAIMPTGQSEYRGEVQVRISVPDAVDGKPTTGAWDPTNDWSYEGVEDAPNEPKYESAFNRHITMYVNDQLVWGTEPDGTTPQPVDPTKPTKPTDPTQPSSSEKIRYGDANVDGKVEIADATLILQFLTNKDEYQLSDQGMINADVDGVEGVTAGDALAIMQLDAGVINQLPIKS